MSKAPVFVTRKFPPSVGGMETLAAGVWRSIESVRPDAILIAYGGSNRRLPLWLPGAIMKLTWLIARRRVESVLTGDALMCAVLAPLLWVGRVSRATMVMGLDLTFDNRLYRRLVHPALRRTPSVIAISAATASVARNFGVPPSQVSVVRLGVETPAPEPSRAHAGRDLRDELDLARSTIVLVTLGRLVRRKGVRWFVEEVLPSLDGSVHYVVAGDGPEADAIAASAHSLGVSDRVHLLGQVDQSTREVLLRGAEVFVQPNVAVAGDMEGFGLVVIEAALRGTPVIAADLEGIKDAVVSGETGILLPTGSGAEWVTTISALVSEVGRPAALGLKFRVAAAELYSEESMGRQISDLLGWGNRPIRPGPTTSHDRL